MFQQVLTVALVLLTALGSLTLATASQSKEPGGEKQIVVDLGGSVKLKMVLIPAGEFMMGSGESAEATAAFFNKYHRVGPNDEYYMGTEGFSDEHPQHLVRITKPFYLGTYHVTRGQFRQFLKESGYKTDAEPAAGRGCWSSGSWDEDLSERKPASAVTVLVHVGKAERLSALERIGDAEEQLDLTGSEVHKIQRL